MKLHNLHETFASSLQRDSKDLILRTKKRQMRDGKTSHSSKRRGGKNVERACIALDDQRRDMMCKLSTAVRRSLAFNEQPRSRIGELQLVFQSILRSTSHNEEAQQPRCLSYFLAR